MKLFSIGKIVSFAFVFSTVFSSCIKDHKGDEISESFEKRNDIIDLMRYAYLWNYTINSSMKGSDFKSVAEAFEECKNKPTDKWSFMVDTLSYNSFQSTGVSEGYGIEFGADFSEGIRENRLKVAYVIKDSPADNAGIERGMIFKNINGTDVFNLIDNDPDELDRKLSMRNAKFTFLDKSDNKLKDYSLTMNGIKATDIFQYSIFKDKDSSNVGYLNYLAFNAFDSLELENVFDFFVANDVKKVVLDLRYNGGGDVNEAIRICNRLKPSSAGTSSVMFKYQHNTKLRENDKTENFNDKPQNLNITKLFVITTVNTASASELIINSLKPYINVELVGSTTHGKPVGMYGFNFYDQYVFAINFKIVNALNQGDYYNGISVDQEIPDDFSQELGDKNEACLRYCLYGTTTSAIARKSSANDLIPFATGGFNEMKGFY